MYDELTTSPTTAVQVVIATVAIYLVFLALVRVLGQRTLATLSLVDAGCVLAVGAILGRTTLLADPTLVTGALALTTLLLARWLTAVALRSPRVERLVQPPPVVLVRDGLPIPGALARTRVSDDHLRHSLRVAGVRSLDQVALVVLERTGQLSVIRGDGPVDPWLVSDLPTGLPTDPQA